MQRRWVKIVHTSSNMGKRDTTLVGARGRELPVWKREGTADRGPAVVLDEASQKKTASTSHTILPTTASMEKVADTPVTLSVVRYLTPNASCNSWTLWEKDVK